MHCRTSHITGRGCRRRRTAPALLACLACLVVTTIGAGAGPEPAREYQVKAAFIYNFGQFVEWPAEAFPAKDSPLVIAVLDPDPFDGGLDHAVAGKSITGHPIVIKHVPAAGSTSLPACHVLFVPSEDDDRVRDTVARVAQEPVLTVGETDAFLKAGGAIRFYLEDGKVRFAIDPDATRRAGLKVSSKLLSLAKIYQR